MRKKTAEMSDTAGHCDPVFEMELVEKLSDELGVPLSKLRGLSTRNRCSQLEAFKRTEAFSCLIFLMAVRSKGTRRKSPDDPSAQAQYKEFLKELMSLFHQEVF